MLLSGVMVTGASCLGSVPGSARQLEPKHFLTAPWLAPIEPAPATHNPRQNFRALKLFVVTPQRSPTRYMVGLRRGLPTSALEGTTDVLREQARFPGLTRLRLPRCPLSRRYRRNSRRRT